MGYYYYSNNTIVLVNILSTISNCTIVLVIILSYYCGTRWRSWLRHCATSRKVAGSIPNGVIGIFH